MTKKIKKLLKRVHKTSTFTTHENKQELSDKVKQLEADVSELKRLVEQDIHPIQQKEPDIAEMMGANDGMAKKNTKKSRRVLSELNKCTEWVDEMKEEGDEVEKLSDQMWNAMKKSLEYASKLTEGNHLVDPFYPLTMLVQELYKKGITDLYKLVQRDVQKEFNDLLNEIKDDLFLERNDYDVKKVLEKIDKYQRRYSNDNKNN